MKKKKLKHRNMLALELYTNGLFKPQTIPDKKKHNKKKMRKKIDLNRVDFLMFKIN